MELVQIDSPSGNERLLANRLKRELSLLDCNVVEDNTGSLINGNTGNIIAELSGNKPDWPVLLLSAHMDRIKPGKGSSPYIDGQYIKSRENVLGADDMAGITVIMETLKYIKNNSIDHGKLIIIFTVAEELGLLGSKNLDPQYYQDCDFGLVFDAEGRAGTIIKKGPAKVKFNAIIKGKPVSTEVSDRGVNAIKIASLAISSMNLGRIDRETNANIGVVRGGIARNIVPDLIELEGEVNSHNQQKINKQIQEIKNIILKYTKKYGGDVEFEIESLYDKFSLDLDHPFLKFLIKTAEKNNLNPQFKISCGGNDVSIFNNNELPAVNLGTGFENAHLVEERLNKEDLFKLIEYTVEIIKNTGKLTNV